MATRLSEAICLDCLRSRGSADNEIGLRVRRNCSALQLVCVVLTICVITGESSLLMCQEYFEAFGSKMCCFDDLKPYFDLLNVEESLALSTGLAAEQAVTEMVSIMPGLLHA